MIKTDQEFGIIKGFIKRFEDALNNDPRFENIADDDLLLKAERDGMQSKLDSLYRDVGKYELKNAPLPDGDKID